MTNPITSWWFHRYWWLWIIVLKFSLSYSINRINISIFKSHQSTRFFLTTKNQKCLNWVSIPCLQVSDMRLPKNISCRGITIWIKTRNRVFCISFLNQWLYHFCLKILFWENIFCRINLTTTSTLAQFSEWSPSCPDILTNRMYLLNNRIREIFRIFNNRNINIRIFHRKIF